MLVFNRKRWLSISKQTCRLSGFNPSVCPPGLVDTRCWSSRCSSCWSSVLAWPSRRTSLSSAPCVSLRVSAWRASLSPSTCSVSRSFHLLGSGSNVVVAQKPVSRLASGSTTPDRKQVYLRAVCSAHRCKHWSSQQWLDRLENWTQCPMRWL